jgi:uncharacterized protein YlzI (FlbEa/FlbD family)
MIRLTDKGDVYIAPEQIISIEPGDDGYSQINTLSGVYFVAESHEEVVRKVLEWRLLMERYRIAGAEIIKQKDAQWLFDDTEVRLKRIAGLEEPNHDTR